MHFYLLLLSLLTSLFVTSCSDDTESPEQQIRQYITQAEQLAEKRDAAGLKELIADNYKDEKNLDKKGMVRMAMGYFLGHQNIHLFTHIKEIHLIDSDKAHVKVFVAMTGKPVSTMDSFLNVRAQLYLFELALIKDDEWLLSRAKWRRAQINEMLNNQ